MEKRYFQYLAGERKEEVVEFDRIEEEDDLVFICFKDNSRCNEELILPLNNRNWSTQLMAEISDPSNKWKFKEEWVGRHEERYEENADGMKVCVQPFIKGRKKITPIPPKPVKSKFGHINSHSTTPLPPTKEVHKLINDPVWIMMEKSKKFDTEIPMVITISLPTKSLYEVAKESFEEGGNKVIEYIISNMDDVKLKNSLRYALKQAYEDNYEKEINNGTNLYSPEVIEEPIIGDLTLSKNNENVNE